MPDISKENVTTIKHRYRLPARLTYAALVDARRREIEISEFMIRRACDEAESKQQFPFAPRNRKAG